MSIRPLSKELQNKANEELHEVPDRIEDDLKLIKNWLSTQPHIKVNTDDQWLISFLRSCKFNYQRTKEKLELFSTQQEQIPEFFENRDPFSDEIQDLLKRGIFTILPQTADPAGPRSFLFRAAFCDPSKVHVKSIVKAAFMLMEILYWEDDNCTVAGVIPLVDLQDFSYKYLAQVTPNLIRKIFYCFIYAYPTRLKKVCFFNCPAFFPIIYKLLKMFAPQKIKSRLHVYSNVDDLFKHIPQSILPKDYGGEEKCCDELADEFKLKIESYKKWFTTGNVAESEVTKI